MMRMTRWFASLVILFVCYSANTDGVNTWNIQRWTFTDATKCQQTKVWLDTLAGVTVYPATTACATE